MNTEFIVHVAFPSEALRAINVSASDSVRVLRGKTAAALGVDPTGLALLHEGVPLDDVTEKVTDTMLVEGSEVEARPSRLAEARRALCEAGRRWMLEDLMAAVAAGEDEVVGLIIDAGEVHTAAALEAAARGGDIHVVKEVTRRCAAGQNYQASLLVAVTKGHVDVVGHLIACGAEITVPCLHKAVTMVDVSMAQLLVAQGADIDAYDASQETPLFAAAEWGRQEAVNLLLSKGSDVHKVDRQGQCPLQAAVYQAAVGGNDSEVVEQLARCTDTNRVAATGFAALHIAASSVRVDVAECLLSHGADVNIRTAKSKDAIDYGLTPLHLAASEQDLDMVKCLVSQGADVQLATLHLGLSPLAEAVGTASNPLVDYLVECGARVDATDAQGATALSIAASLGHIRTARRLIDYGACVNAKDNGGSTPLSAATQAGKTAMAAYLVSRGAVNSSV